MPRARFIRPEFFTDSTTGRLPMETRLLYIACWTQADIQGVLEWDADQLRLAAFPYDKLTAEQVAAMMADLERTGRVGLFTNDGKPYAVIRKWEAHQSFTTGEKKNGPRFPGPESDHSQTIVRHWSDIGQTPSPTLSPSPSPTPSPPPAPTPSPASRAASRRTARTSRPVMDNPPTVDEVRAFVDEIDGTIDAQEFLDENARRGWTYGKERNPVMDWKAHYRAWMRRRAKEEPQGPTEAEHEAERQRQLAIIREMKAEKE